MVPTSYLFLSPLLPSLSCSLTTILFCTFLFTFYALNIWHILQQYLLKNRKNREWPHCYVLYSSLLRSQLLMNAYFIWGMNFQKLLDNIPLESINSGLHALNITLDLFKPKSAPPPWYWSLFFLVHQSKALTKTIHNDLSMDVRSIVSMMEELGPLRTLLHLWRPTTQIIQSQLECLWGQQNFKF